MLTKKNYDKNDQDMTSAKVENGQAQSTWDIKKCFSLDLKIQKRSYTSCDLKYSKNYKL